jgi:hypothetical protein
MIESTFGKTYEKNSKNECRGLVRGLILCSKMAIAAAAAIRNAESAAIRIRLV